MQTDLIIYDIKNFINKYTRFLTKEIYISKELNNAFLDQYKYLFQILKEDKFLYTDNKNYQKLSNLIKNNSKLLRLHNQKYLSHKINNNAFFNSLTPPLNLDIQKQKFCLIEEKNLLLITKKNVAEQIALKIKYLKEYHHLKTEEILLLVEKNQLQNIQEKLEKILKNSHLKIITKENLLNEYLKDKQPITSSLKKNILLSYLEKNLFSDKIAFNNLYNTFREVIYLNKDYKDFDTFKDYHNYMYKRRYLSTKLDLKTFNLEEIKRRKKYLRTLNNETLNTKEEVDIANFLWINSINYTYNQQNRSFIIKNNNQQQIIYYHNQKEESSYEKERNNTIHLYRFSKNKNRYLEQLVEKLQKNHFILFQKSEELIYQKLKTTTMGSYFEEFINNYILPAIDIYEKNNSLISLNLSKKEIIILEPIINYYQTYLKEHNLINEKDQIKYLEKILNTSTYKLIITLNDISLKTIHPTLTIQENYPETSLFKHNIKLLYDYKTYLYQNKTLPLPNVYQNIEELNRLTQTFLKENLTRINKSLKKNKIPIYLIIYNDQENLKINTNIAIKLEETIKKYHLKNPLMIASNKKDVDSFILKSNSTKIDKNTIHLSNNTKITIALVSTKKYDNIIIPFLIKPKIHQNLLERDTYQIKITLYMNLLNTQKNLFLFVPTSRVKELKKILNSLNVKETQLA